MPSPLASAIYRYVPAIDSLRTYSLGHFKRDMFAGLTVAAVAVPQAMAYASIFGMPVEMGLYTAIIMTAVGALLDSSKQLINGPTNAISIAMFSALSIVPEDQRVSAAHHDGIFHWVDPNGDRLVSIRRSVSFYFPFGHRWFYAWERPFSCSWTN